MFAFLVAILAGACGGDPGEDAPAWVTERSPIVPRVEPAPLPPPHRGTTAARPPARPGPFPPAPDRCRPYGELAPRWTYRDAGTGGPALIAEGEALGTVTAARTLLVAVSLATGERRLAVEVTDDYRLRFEAQNLLVFEGPDRKAVEARSRLDGRYLWRVLLRNGFTTGLFAADQDRLYVNDWLDDDTVRVGALDLVTGSILWHRDYPTDGPSLPGPARLAGDLVFATMTFGRPLATRIVAIGAADGDERWSVALEGVLQGVLPDGAGGLYAATGAPEGRRLVALGADGLRRWSAAVPTAAGDFVPQWADEDRVFLSNGIALDAATGEVAYRVDGWVSPAGFWSAGDRGFAARVTPDAPALDLFSFGLADGAVAWTRTLGGGPASAWTIRHAAPTASGSLLALLGRPGTSGERQLCEFAADGTARARRLPPPPVAIGPAADLPAADTWLETFETRTLGVPGIEVRAYDLAGFSSPLPPPALAE